MRQRSRGFTLVELIVVIGIIATLFAMLLPSLRKARMRAEVISCGSRLRAFGIGLQCYTADYREYPVTWMTRTKVTLPLLDGEHCGFMGSAIRDLLVSRKYTTTVGMQCTAQTPGLTLSQGGLLRWSGNVDEPYYCYGGPSMLGMGYYGCGHSSGLNYQSQLRWYNPPNIGDPYLDDPHFWGVSVHNLWRRPVAVCPSLQRIFTSNWGCEPHDNYPQTVFTDFALGDSWTVRRKNYLFNDGSVVYVSFDQRPASLDAP